MELTTKIIIGAAALGVTGFLLWPSPASASAAANKPPPAGASLDLSQVRDVQKGLNGVGYSVGTYGADGLFGPDTAAAVRKFNQDHGGPSSGQITDAFRAKLATALRAKGYNVTKETGPLLDKMTGPVHGGTLVTGVTGLMGAIVGACVGRRRYMGGPGHY
jgi:peptidoglycan hydrolase-like protein with peptidoglycan-binding domain